MWVLAALVSVRVSRTVLVLPVLLAMSEVKGRASVASPPRRPRMV